jgi:hypothetical protein
MSRKFAPLPHDDPIGTGEIVLPDGERTRVAVDVTFPWERWFGSLGIDVIARPERVAIVDLSGQGASIAATSLPVGSITHGVYRVSYYARITRAATTSSSLTVAVTWPDSVTCTHTGAAITGNTTATFQEDVITMDVDSAGPIQYSTTYASVGAVSMQYKLVVTCEKVDV